MGTAPSHGLKLTMDAESDDSVDSDTQPEKQPTGKAPAVSKAKRLIEIDKPKMTITRTNEVAPIIIKNLKEEFQQVSDFKEPIVYGRLLDNGPEHPLVKSQYFMVRDVQKEMDLLSTMSLFSAPNVRKASGNYPVYGMGQPTGDGLERFISDLEGHGYTAIILLNLRCDPVLFINDGNDMVPYSPRHLDHLEQYICNNDVTLTSELEVDLRKEMIQLATLKCSQMFYFYDSARAGDNEPAPRLYRAAFEDNVSVTQEIYARLAFGSSRIRYLRMCWPRTGAPMESNFDEFISLFKNLPSYLKGESSDTFRRQPAIVCTSQSGIWRATLGMVIGVIIISHRQQLHEDNSIESPVTENDGSLKGGEWHAIRKLVNYLPNGQRHKYEVDTAIDSCSELVNLRTAIWESRCRLDSFINAGNNQASEELEICCGHLERYFYLICFKAYLHDTYPHSLSNFSQSFSQWMSVHATLCAILKNADVSERNASFDLLEQKGRYLVADNYIGLDVLSSQMDVKVSNFRKVPGLSIFGTAQPAREGLRCVVNFLTSKKQDHSTVVWFNLRQDLVVQCGESSTYSWREATQLDEPIILPGISASEIHDKEEDMKHWIQSQESIEVYGDLDRKPTMIRPGPCMTCTDLYAELVMQAVQISYHRLPMGDDRAPDQEVFDAILAVVRDQHELATEDSGPAFLFQCRTGKGRTTTAMAIAGLVIFHLDGFPFGTKAGEEERVSLPNAQYTQGHYKAVQDVIRRIPDGHQVKREVDFILNQCSDTMTPMHYHIREIIFVTYNKTIKAKTEEEKEFFKRRSLDFLQRYIYLILFNAYLHSEKENGWQRTFANWMIEVAGNAGMHEILDNLSFADFEQSPLSKGSRRTRRKIVSLRQGSTVPVRGQFM